jgi:mycothiol synthase
MIASKGTVANFAIRAFEPADLEPVLELINTSHQADGIPLRLTAEAFMAQARDEQGQSERHYLVAEAHGQPVAFCDLIREAGTRLISRVWIHPDWRARDVGRLLIERRVEEASCFEEPVLDIPVRPDQQYKADLLQGLGFRAVRTWWLMRIDLSQHLPPAEIPPGFCFRTAIRGQDDEMLTELMNDTFSEHWGEGQHSLEEVRHDLALPWFDPQLLVFAETQGQPVGYVWSWIQPWQSASSAAACAYIGDLGVRAGYRRRGLGRALLMRALADLKARGMSAAELELDGPNANAKQLYVSVGFREHVELRWYRKQVRPVAKADAQALKTPLQHL